MLDWSRVLSEEFLGPVISLVRDSRMGQVAVVTIDLDPVEWYKGSGRYGAVIFDGHDTPADVLHVCMEHPPDQPKWSITLAADTIALFPCSCEAPDWCVYRERRSCEVGIIALKNERLMHDFLVKDTNHITTDAQEAVETFMGLAFRPKFVVPDDFKREFLRNYTDKKLGTDPI
jgi:hypothetical protein